MIKIVLYLYICTCTGDLFRCLCCPRPIENPASEEFKAVQKELYDTKVCTYLMHGKRRFIQTLKLMSGR